MFISRFGFVGLLLEKAIEAIADRLFTSSLEKDFGEASEDDIVLPDARWVELHPVDAYEVPFTRMSAMIDGLTSGHLIKVSNRLLELRVGRSVTYQFQVRGEGVPVELQLILTKQKNHDVEIDFRSSEAILKLVQVAFNES